MIYNVRLGVGDIGLGGGGGGGGGGCKGFHTWRGKPVRLKSACFCKEGDVFY